MVYGPAPVLTLVPEFIQSTVHHQTTALLQGMCLFWFEVVYELWLVGYSLETVVKVALHSHSDTSGDFIYVFQHDTYTYRPAISTLHVLHTWLQASIQLWVSKRSTVILFICLVLKSNLLQQKIPLCIWITFGSPLCDGPCLWRWVVMTSNHLNISSVWKLLVASSVYMYVAEVWTGIFSVFVSNTKVLVSRAKYVPLQFQKCSSQAQNTLVASDKHVCLKCARLMSQGNCYPGEFCIPVQNSLGKMYPFGEYSIPHRCQGIMYPFAENGISHKK